MRATLKMVNLKGKGIFIDVNEMLIGKWSNGFLIEIVN